MGSDEGGLEELVELRLSRASRSATRWSSSAIRHRSDSKTAMRAACASGGTVFQSDSEIGSVALIHSDYVLTVQKVRSVSAYLQDKGGPLGPSHVAPRLVGNREVSFGIELRAVVLLHAAP